MVNKKKGTTKEKEEIAQRKKGRGEEKIKKKLEKECYVIRKKSRNENVGRKRI